MPRARKPLIPHASEVAEGRADPDLDALYRSHAAWLRASLRRRLGPGGTAVAEDLVQEAYLRALMMQARTPWLHPRALLRRIAGRLLIDDARRRRRAGALEADPAIAPATQDAQVLLKQLLLDLPDPLRETFLLHRFAGLSYEEIAQRLGISVKTVEWRISKALARLAAALSR